MAQRRHSQGLVLPAQAAAPITPGGLGDGHSHQTAQPTLRRALSDPYHRAAGDQPAPLPFPLSPHASPFPVLPAS